MTRGRLRLKLTYVCGKAGMPSWLDVHPLYLLDVPQLNFGGVLFVRLHLFFQHRVLNDNKPRESEVLI